MNDEWLDKWMTWGTQTAAGLPPVLTVVLIMLVGGVVYFCLARLATPLITGMVSRSRLAWAMTLIEKHLLQRVSALIAGLAMRALVSEWLPPESVSGRIMQVAVQLWILAVGLVVVYAILDAVVTIYNKLAFARQMPIRGFVQAVKLVAMLVVMVMAIAMLMGKSPALLVSGLGAMTAVMMLIFKDPIMGFVAGIQLSANRMLAVGDWLEMPKYQADGDVIEITLTTVKVRNWDQTITTVPTYALIADSFKNWRGMQEVGGRRIMRSLFIDMHSVGFLTPADIERLRKAQLISTYIDKKIDEIEAHNRTHCVDSQSRANGRHLTNIGTFRAYLLAYLKAHPGMHPDLIMMVRQLQPTAQGLPMQIYAFTRDTAWVAHEGVQSDIFDHLLAVLPEFGLRVYQMPSGNDLRNLTRLPDDVA